MKQIIRLLEKARNYLLYKVDYKSLSKLIEDISDVNLTNKKIVFNTIRTFPHVLDVDMFLAVIMAKLGAKTSIIVDDGILKHWDSRRVSTMPHPTIISPKNLSYNHIYNKKIFSIVVDAYKHKNLKIIKISEIIDEVSDSDVQDSKDIIHVNLKKAAKSSTKRFFETSDINLDDKMQRTYYDLSMFNANTSLKIGHYIHNYLKPDIFVTSHGIYSLWGPCFEYLRETDIRCWVLDPFCYIPQAVSLSEIIFQMRTASLGWKEYSEREVTVKMREKVEEYFNSRLKHKTRDNKIYFNETVSTPHFNIKTKHTACVFPNIVWDGDVEERNKIFNGVIDWLVKIVSFLRSNKDLTLIIRFHPSEHTWFKGVRGVEDILRDKIQDIDDIPNLILISSNAKVDSYDLVKKYADFALVYDGILGLELPYIGIPVMVCGNEGFTRVSGVNFTVSSESEYFDTLKNPDKMISEFRNLSKRFNENLIRYAYWFLYDSNNKIPTITKELNYRKIASKSELKKDDIDLFKNKDLRKIVEKILGEKISKKDEKNKSEK